MKKLIKQTTILTISNVLVRFTGMLFFVLLARYSSVSDYGLFRYLITIASLYAILFSGIPTAMTKFIGENKSDNKGVIDYIDNSLILMFITFFILVIIIVLFNSNKIYLILLLFAVLIDTLYLGFISGLLNYVKLFGFKLIENMIQLVILLISYFLYKEVNFTFAVIFFSFSGLISLFIFECFKFEFKLRFKYDKDKIKRIIKYTIPVALGAIGWQIMFGINTIFIQKFYNATQVGYYSVGITLVQIFTFLPAAICTIMLPKVASTQQKEKIYGYTKLAVIASLVISFAILILLLVFKSWLLNMIFTSKYLPALVILLPLSLGQICISLHQIYASVWQGLGRPGVPSITISIAAVLNIVGSYFLTKSYGIVGAAISNAITSFIALMIISIWFHSKWKILLKE